MKMILKKVHIYFYVLCVALLYFIMWPLFYFFSRKPSRYHTLNRLRGFWAGLSSGMAGFFYRFEYEVPVDWSKTYIVCPNHTSNLDISAMCVMVKNDCCFMGKEELKDGLVTGLFFRTVDIPVNRESKISSYRAFKKAVERIQEGITLVIFPEGGIPPHYPPAMVEFKNGPFRMAIEQKVPIIPVSGPDAWQLLWDDGTKYGTRPGIAHFYVHKPIDTINLTIEDTEALRDRVYQLIRQKVEGVAPTVPEGEGIQGSGYTSESK